MASIAAGYYFSISVTMKMKKTNQPVMEKGLKAKHIKGESF